MSSHVKLFSPRHLIAANRTISDWRQKAFVEAFDPNQSAPKADRLGLSRYAG